MRYLNVYTNGVPVTEYSVHYKHTLLANGSKIHIHARNRLFELNVAFLSACSSKRQLYVGCITFYNTSHNLIHHNQNYHKYQLQCIFLHCDCSQLSRAIVERKIFRSTNTFGKPMLNGLISINISLQYRVPKR